jgi:hypothetical protein
MSFLLHNFQFSSIDWISQIYLQRCPHHSAVGPNSGSGDLGGCRAAVLEEFLLELGGRLALFLFSKVQTVQAVQPLRSVQTV